MSKLAVFSSPQPASTSERVVSSWEGARDFNFENASRLLELNGIRYVEVDDERRTRRQLSLASGDRNAVIAALERYSQTGGFVAALDSDRTLPLPFSFESVSSSVRSQLLGAGAVELWHATRLGENGRFLGREFAVVLSFWEPRSLSGHSFIVAGAPNRWTKQLPCADPDQSALDLVTRELADRVHIEDVLFPIDLVYLWVDGGDPDWSRRRADRMAEIGLVPQDDGNRGAVESVLHQASAVSDEARKARLYRSRDELRYSIRSAQMYAPFINHIYLVTDQQTPDWLDTTVDGLTIVDHQEIFPAGSPPVFNSSALDTRLHLIPGLSEHFLVTNDDIFFYNPAFPVDYFTSAGAMRLFLSKARIPFGEPVDGEPAVDSATRNIQRMIAREHGVTITNKFKHIPIPQRVSARHRVAERYMQEVDQTTRSSFRSMTDISFGHLTLYESLLAGEAVVSGLPYDYVSLDAPRLQRRLQSLVDNPGRNKVICLNDADLSVSADARERAEIERDAAVAEFMERSFPQPSRFERPI